MTSYCAPCIADLALVREAVTSVAGTASCMAHAVLLTHGTDDPGRRRQRLDALRDLAGSKAEAAEAAEQAKLELLVQEYGLAGAMDMGSPLRRPSQGRQGGPGQGGPGEERRPRPRRGRVRPGDRPSGPGGEGGESRREHRPAAETAAETPTSGAGDAPPAGPVEAGAAAPAPAAPAPAAPAPDA